MYKNKTKKALITLLAAVFAFCIILATLNVSGISVFAEHDHSGDTALTTTYLSNLGTETDSDGTTYYDLPSGNYYLTGNISVGYTIRIQNGASVSLCLNGYTLSFAGSSSYRYPVFEVLGSEEYNSDGSVDTSSVVTSSFSVTDCSSNGKGTISGDYKSGSVIKAYLANVTIENGNITGGRGTVVYDPYDNNAALDAEQDGSESYNGYAYGDESFYLQGGGIYALDSNLTITGGVVYGNGAASSTALYNGETVKQYLRLYNGSLGWGGDGTRVTISDDGVSSYLSSYTENTDYYKDDSGYIYRTFTKGDTVTFSRAQGGGIFIGTSYEWSGGSSVNNNSMEHRSTFTMSGGSISNNVCYMHGAGMFVHNVDFTMKGGVIGGSTNYLAKYTADGASISMENGGNYAVAGLESFSNSSCSGGGIYVYRGVSRGYGNDIKITGTAEISYNYSAGQNSAFTITEGSTLAISGSVSVAYNHGNGTVVSISSADTSIDGLIYQYNTSTSTASFGISIGSTLNDEGGYLYGSYSVSITNSYFRYNTSGTYGSASEDGANGSGPLSITANAENYVTLSGVTVTDNTFTNGNGVSITGGKLTITDCTFSDNISTGRYVSGVVSSSNYPAISINKPVTLSFTDCTITGNSSTGAGAVYINGANNGATYVISNLVISDNEVIGRYNANTDTTTVGTGGALNIGGGTSGGTGNSIYSISNVTVSDNTHYGTYGGIYVANTNYGTTITMTNCTITGNSGTSNGGGMWLGYGVTATLTDCTISDNTAGSMGELTSDGTAVETAGTGGSGGGIFLNSAYAGSTTLLGQKGAILIGYGLVVSNNTATNQGGGIYVSTGAIVTASNYYNVNAGTTYSGASVTLSASSKANSSITDNYATGYYSTTLGNDTNGRYDGITSGYGGGVYIAGSYNAAYAVGIQGTFTMTGGSISGNTSLNSGGGIYSSGTVTLTNVSVDNNAATGMYEDYYLVSTLQTTNQAGNYGKGMGAQGGGIYMTTTGSGYLAENNKQYASLTISGGSVSGNKANYHGAGMSLNGYGLTVTISNCTINSNETTGGYVNSVTGGVSTAYGSYITASKYSYVDGYGGGLYISSVYKVTISNSDISYNSAASGGGIYLTTSGYAAGSVTLSSGSASYSKGLYATELTISGTTISNNTAAGYINEEYVYSGTTYSNYSAGIGGGVCLTGNGYTFTMTGGSISNNSANNGGGLYQTASYNSSYSGTGSGTAALSGVTISGNEATVYQYTTINTSSVITTQYSGGLGGGIYVVNSTALPSLTLSNSTTVSGNVAENTGGGIYIGNSNATNYAVVKLDSSSVTGNYTKYATYDKTTVTYTASETSSTKTETTTMSGYGAGVYVAGVYAQLIVEGTANVSGNAIINGETATNNNVYINSVQTNNANASAVIYISGALTDGASIYVTTNNTSTSSTVYIRIAALTNGSELTLSDYISYLHSDVDNYEFVDGSGYSYSNYIIRIYSSGKESTATNSYSSGALDAGASASTAFTLTVELTVDGSATMTGTTSAYYTTNEALNSTTATYNIVINDGYYFGKLVVDGVTYYYNSGNLTSSGSSSIISAVTITNNTSYLTVTITYASDLSGSISNSALAYSIALTVKSTDGYYTVSEVNGTTPETSSAGAYVVEYSGNGVTVAVQPSGGTSASASGGSILSSFVSTSSYTVQYLVGGTWGTTAPTEAGTYQVRIVWTQTGFVGSTTYGAWILTITAQTWTSDSHESVEATLSQTEYYYAAGASFTPTVTVTNTVLGSALAADTDYVVTYSGNINAGNGVVTITGIGNYTGSFTVGFVIYTIDSLSVDSSAITAASGTYDGTSKGIEIGSISAINSYSDGILYTIVRSDGESVSASEYISYSGSTYTFYYTNAGTYTVTIYTEGNANYNAGEHVVTITIAKGASVIDTSSVDTTATTYNGAEQSYSLGTALATAGTATVSITYSLADEYEGAYISNGTLYVKYAGTYSVLLTVNEQTNYAGATETLTFTVNKLSLTVPSYTGSNSFVYDGDTHTLTISTYETAYISVDGNEQSEVGTYNVTFSLVDSANTQWSDSTTGNKTRSYSITQAENAITAGGSASYTYTYNGSAQGASDISITSAFSSGDMTYEASTGVNASFTSNALTFSVTNAGTYTITFTSLGGSNYTADTYTITVTVYSAINTLTAGGSTEYSYTYNGSAQSVSLGTMTAAQGGDITTSVTYNSAASSYTVTLGESGYSFSFTNAGTYVVTFTSASTDNYSSDNVTVTITVEKAANSITTGDITKTYTYSGSQSIDVSGVVSDFGTVEVAVTNGGTYSDGKVLVENAGNYTISFTVAESDNYDGATATLAIVVNPYTLDKPIATGTSYVYTGEAQTFAFTSDEGVDYYTVTGNEKTNAGTTYVYVSLNDTTNYTWADGTISTLSYTFTIAKATPSYTIPTGLSYTAGTVLSTITLPSGWAWVDATAKVSSSVSGYSAIYTPSDTDNYTTVTAEIAIEVKTATVSAGVSSDVRGEVSASSGFTETVTLNVNTVETSDYDADEEEIVETVVSQTTIENATVVSVYEINLTSASGSQLTISSATDDGSVTVTVAIPSDAIGEDFYIVHIHDGAIVDTLDSSEYTVSNGYVTFTVSELSQFAFVIEAATDVAENTVIIMACVDAVLIVAAVVLLAVNNRRKRRAKAL